MKKRSRVIPPTVRRAVLERDGYACTKCRKKLALVNPNRNSPVINLHLHHKVEFVNGGEHTLDNLVTLCTKCHRQADLEHIQTARAKAYAKKMKPIHARGLISYTEAARLLGVGVGPFNTLRYRHRLETFTDPSFPSLRLVSKAQVLKLKEPTASAA